MYRFEADAAVLSMGSAAALSRRLLRPSVRFSFGEVDDGWAGEVHGVMRILCLERLSATPIKLYR